MLKVRLTDEEGNPLNDQSKLSSNDVDGKTIYTISITNIPGAALPYTGGPGTTALYLLGFTLTGLAGTGLVTRKKQRETA